MKKMKMKVKKKKKSFPDMSGDGKVTKKENKNNYYNEEDKINFEKLNNFKKEIRETQIDRKT